MTEWPCGDSSFLKILCSKNLSDQPRKEKGETVTELNPHILLRISEFIIVFQISGRAIMARGKLSELGEVVLFLNQSKPLMLWKVLCSATVCEAAKAQFNW